MIFLPDDKMNINKFVDVQLPSKVQIFSRTGQRAVAPGGFYTGDDAVKFGMKPTDQANAFIDQAESYETPKEDLTE